jgi:aspartate/methionine/tyrosine aminotransferase
MFATRQADLLSQGFSRLGTEKAFEVLGLARALEAQGRSIVHLEIGEPDFDTPDHIKRAGIEAIERNYTHYAPVPGIPELRDEVAQYAAKLRGVPPWTRENVVIGPGCKMVIWNVLSALVDPGDEVVLTDPGYPAYASVLSYLQAKTVLVPLLESQNYSLDLDVLARRVTDRTKIIVLNTPQNPTGGVLTKRDLQEVAKLAQHHDCLVLVDEIYCRHYHAEEPFVSMVTLPGMRERTILIDGFSKAFAMTGWRLGYGVMPEWLAHATTLFNNNTFSCVSTFVQHAGIAALRGSEESIVHMAQTFRRRRDVIIDGLNALPGVSCMIPDGAFYAFPNITEITNDDQHLARWLLEEAGVAVLGGSSFGDGGAGHLRLSYASSIETINVALERMRDALPTYKPA